MESDQQQQQTDEQSTEATANQRPTSEQTHMDSKQQQKQNNQTARQILDDRLKYPSRDGTYLSQLYNQPLVTTLTSFSHVANLVRNPYELINNVDEFVRHASGNNNNRHKFPRTSENFARTLNQNRRSLTPTGTPVIREMDTFVADEDETGHNRSTDSTGERANDAAREQTPVPVIPPIDASNKRGRLEPLTIEEYESKLRQSATDLELIERIFAGSLAGNQLRAALWPYLFGLILHRGKFDKIKGPDNDQEAYVFVEHEANYARWLELKDLFEKYRAQWEAILPDQEMRFSTFRERKSLIERDVIRCDRLHPFYADAPQNLTKLTNLLMTYMMYDFDIGYVQGMSDIAGPILCMYNGDLVKSFWVFVEVMKLFRRNFEFTQKTIHFQLNCLYELVKNTDPVFALYLEENDLSNCFFAFRAIVCQFKRELMKEDEDDYTKVLFLWDTIWCVERRRAIQEEMDKLVGDDEQLSDVVKMMHDDLDNNSSRRAQQPITEQPVPCLDNPFAISVDPNQADSPRYKLTETEIFVLALCLSMIRRERDIIMAKKLDGTEIHLHFIDPKLASDLSNFIEHAINIYSYLKDDFDLTKLTSPTKQPIVQQQQQQDQQPTDPMESNADASPISADGYDSLSDFLIIGGASGS